MKSLPVVIFLLLLPSWLPLSLFSLFSSNSACFHFFSSNSACLHFFSIFTFSSSSFDAFQTQTHTHPNDLFSTKSHPLSLLASATVITLHDNATFADRVANFGPRIGDEGVRGTLVPLEVFNYSNLLGCNDMEVNPNVSSWIALVQRGDCNFVEKVRTMQRAGAIAVIVGDNIPDSDLISMGALEDTRDIKIPSVFVSKSSYDSLVVRGAPMDGEYWLPILITSDAVKWPMLDIVIVTIIAPSIIMVFIYSIWRFRTRRERKVEVAPKSVVINLPVRKYVKIENAEVETCPICLDDYQEGAELRILPCKHEFHTQCIDQWLTTRKRLCPLCKKDACPEGTSERTPLVIRNLFSSPPPPSSSSSRTRGSEPTDLEVRPPDAVIIPIADSEVVQPQSQDQSQTQSLAQAQLGNSSQPSNQNISRQSQSQSHGSDREEEDSEDSGDFEGGNSGADVNEKLLKESKNSS